MKIATTRPHGFEFGMWKIVVDLEPDEEEVVGHGPLVFDLPDLQQRLFIVVAPFCRPAPAGSEYPYRGEFVDNRWEGTVKANGEFENSCVMTIEQVNVALEAKIREAIQLFP